MEKKKIIGISSFEGSDTYSVLADLQYVLKRKSVTLFICSLEDHDQECIHRMIERHADDVIYVIDKISTVEEIDYFASKFADHEFEAILIQIPWDECFPFLQQQGLIAQDCQHNEWRLQNETSEYRKNIMKCSEKISGERTYRYKQEIANEIIGRLADDILRM